MLQEVGFGKTAAFSIHAYLIGGNVSRQTLFGLQVGNPVNTRVAGVVDGWVDLRFYAAFDRKY